MHQHFSMEIYETNIYLDTFLISSELGPTERQQVTFGVCFLLTDREKRRQVL